ncbi:PREDICTED: E4 SUMO-protein ligase PIAL1-like isoform X2 [Nelumbo nucifera]|uniref:E4 SUMO-protein ligase PIAL1-like isoform X2 n=1 Tax=Nelumbo nucifera TaxID=4432 RepID=A0A1U8PZW1_NELNU|nr:PREDICTED: E4 SUMO-protein ligase PIAL1-like isoform X2 [Nelumbo nucifera]
MAGATHQLPPVSNAGAVSTAIGNPASALHINKLFVATVAERLSMQLNAQRSNPQELSGLCITMARGIDLAVAWNQVPARVEELPPICRKNACKCGWFSAKDTEDLLSLAKEIENLFCSGGCANIEPSHSLPVISNVMTRFYPRIRMGHILTCLQIKPGYGAFVTDFQISKTMVSATKESIRLFVAQTDHTETSSCIISPPQVNFLLNGRGVDRRVYISMDSGPQFPTNLKSMLKYGTNLLQAVGHFNAKYIIAVAFMSDVASSDNPELQDYVQPAVSSLDSEVIEGPSRISLNCPISRTRIKTPVKGHLCKHHQCFDYDNFMEINSRRPSWRCPHCNQTVCCTDIRIDQNMVKVLREVAEGVADVIIAADGSWKPVFENDDSVHQTQNTTCQEDGSEQSIPTKFSKSNNPDDVVDLTMGDDGNNIMDSSQIEDRKPFHDNYQFLGAARNFTVPLEVSSASEQVHNAASHTEDNIWSGILSSISSASYGSLAPSTRFDTVVGDSESIPANFMPAPVLTDAVSPALNRGSVDVCGTIQPTTSIPQSQFCGPYNLQLQQSQFGNSMVSSEYGRSSIRHVSRTPIAIQALPAQTQMPSSHQRQRTNLNSLMPNVAVSSVPQSSPFISPITDGLNVNGSDTERQQQFSRPIMNPLAVPDIASSSMHNHSTTQRQDHQERQYISNQALRQAVGVTAASHIPGAYRSSSRLPSEPQNLLLQQAPHTRVSQTLTQSASLLRPPTNFPLSQIQQGGAQGVIGQATAGAINQHAWHMAGVQRAGQTTRPPPAVPVQLQAPRASSVAMNTDGLRMGEQRGSMKAMVQPVSTAGSSEELPSEQNWRPTGRMRGSLAGRAYSAAIGHLMIQPTQTQPSQAPLPPSNQISAPADTTQLQVLIANSINAHGPVSQAYQRIRDAAARAGTLGVLPERSQGV